MTNTEATNGSNGPKDQAFFAEEASKQILVRVAGVLQDPDICDAVFIVDDGNEKEEIRAPSQVMAMSSPFFKSLFYPVRERNQRNATKNISKNLGLPFSWARASIIHRGCM